MQYRACSCFCFLVLLVHVFPSQVYCSHSGDYKVLIWNRGLVKIGEISSFDAEVVLKPEARTRHKANENVTFEFSWKIPFQPWIKHQKTSHRWDSFQWRWTEAGNKTVSVSVRILNKNGRDSTQHQQRFFPSYSSYYATNRTKVTVTGIYATDKIIATLDAYQNSTAAGSQSFYAGTVTLEVKIRNLPHQYLSNITYDWNFGDGTAALMSPQLNNLTHNFTTVKTCTVVVNLYGWIQSKLCLGTTSRTLTFTVYSYLVSKSSAGPKLPSGHPYVLPMKSPIEFEVKFKDPFNLVSEVFTDWKFGDGSSVRNWKNATIYHTFHKEGKYSLWVTIRVKTKFLGRKSLEPIAKTLHIRAPVSLKVRHKHLEHKDKTMRFNISCNGSLPVSFQWCISKQCHLPPGEKCSPTMVHNSSCNLIVNHRFKDPGKYCVNIGVMNDVSGTNTSLMVQIPGDVPGPKHSSSKKSLTGIIIALAIACMLFIVIIVLVTRKWIYSRSEKTEKADFEFRDDDALSVSSVELYRNNSCFGRFGIWGSRKTGENVPFCRDTCMYSL